MMNDTPIHAVLLFCIGPVVIGAVGAYLTYLLNRPRS